MEIHLSSPGKPLYCTLLMLEYITCDVIKSSKVSLVWSTTYHRCVRGPRDTGSTVSGESHGANVGPGRTALLHCRDNPGTSEKPLRTHVGKSQPLVFYTTSTHQHNNNNNKVSFKKAEVISSIKANTFFNDHHMI